MSTMSIEPHAYDTEEEREAYNGALYDIMEYADKAGESLPKFIGSMILPPAETCPEIEEMEKALHMNPDIMR